MGNKHVSAVTKLGDGTFRIGSNIGGSGNGTVTGSVAAGAGSLFRVGGSGTTTFSGINAFTGTAGLEVGAGLKLNATPSGSAGTAVLSGANDYSGGTTVNPFPGGKKAGDFVVRGRVIGVIPLDSSGSVSVSNLNVMGWSIDTPVEKYLFCQRIDSFRRKTDSAHRRFIAVG